MLPTPLLLALAVAAALTGAPAAGRAGDPGWVTIDRADGFEIAVDTVAYEHVGDDTFRVAFRVRYVERSRHNAPLWDAGARQMVLDEEVACARADRPLRLRTRGVRVESGDGSPLGDRATSREWIVPPPGSVGARYGEAVCRLLPPRERTGSRGD